MIEKERGERGTLLPGGGKSRGPGVACVRMHYYYYFIVLLSYDVVHVRYMLDGERGPLSLC